MSFQAKSNLAMLAVVTVVYAGYGLVVASWAGSTPVEDIIWQPLMLLTVVPVTVLAILAHIVLVAGWGRETDTVDERDRIIDLRGEWLGGMVLAAAVFVGIAAAMLEADSFWVAHVLLAGLVLAEIAKDARTLVLYRRGV